MLNGLVHPTKFEKTTKLKATEEFIKEGHQIAQTAYKSFSMVRKIVKNQIRNIKF